MGLCHNKPPNYGNYKWYKNKKDVRLVALRPHILGIAKRLNQMNYEETIFPRRGIYT